MRSKKSNSLTDFEIAVYGAVLEIPLGATRSYGWVAARIGRHGAARAVGNALNKNSCAPFVPCHRVIAADGSLGGYSGGAAKKKALLEHERFVKMRLKDQVKKSQIVRLKDLVKKSQILRER